MVAESTALALEVVVIAPRSAAAAVASAVGGTFVADKRLAFAFDDNTDNPEEVADIHIRSMEASGREGRHLQKLRDWIRQDCQRLPRVLPPGKAREHAE